MNRAKAYVVLIIAIAALFSCTIRQEIQLSADQSGNVVIAVQLKPSYTAYLSDLSEATTEKAGKDPSLFDQDEIRKSLSEHQGVTIKKLTTTRSAMNLELVFADLMKLFEKDKKLENQTVLKMTRQGDLVTLKFHLEKKNYRNITAVFPMLEKPVFQSFAPQPDEDITEREYLDMIEFALGDKGPKEVMDSTLEVKVNIKGSLISQKGGTQSGNSVVFKVPLLRILLLNQSVDFEINFK